MSLRTEAPDGGAGREKVGLALAGRAMACARVADEDGGAGARFEDRRPGITGGVGIAMAGSLAQALGRFRAQLVAETCDLAWRHPRAAWRYSGLGFDQFDPGGDYTPSARRSAVTLM